MLLAERIGRGDRVIIALDNSAEQVAAYFGVMKAGGVAIPLPSGARNDRLAKAVIDGRPRACIIDAATARELGTDHPLTGFPSLFVVAPGAGTGWRDWREAVAAAAEEPPRVRPIDVDLAAIIYTSGSTGEPRGVMLTHRNIVSNTRSIVQYLALTATDRVMCVLPFHYVYGASLLHTHLAVGASVVIDNRFAFPNVVLKAMQTHAVTGFAGVPSTFALLLHRSNLEETSLPALRYVTQAGGGMAADRISEWLARGPKVPFYVMYGATEASARLTYLHPDDLLGKLGSIGRPIPNVEIAVVKDDGTRAAPGEAGELVARGSNISRGYWNNAAETAEKFGPLGYRTGDLGYADEDGYLFLVGRRNDMIKVGGERVGAKEIEDVLHGFPGAHEAAVVGVPHEILGEVPVAFLSLSDRTEPALESLQAFCRSRLPAHKMPARFVFLSDLPKIGNLGKIDKVTLKQIAAQAADRGAA